MKYLIVLLVLFACSKKSEDVKVSHDLGEQKIEIDNSQNLSEVEIKLNSILESFKKNEMPAAGFGSKVAEILESKEIDLDELNATQKKQFYSAFFSTFNSKFKDGSDESLVFLASLLKINNDDFSKLNKINKEKVILDRIGALSENTYLETQFFLANYFYNSKLIDSLTKLNEQEDKKYTVCKGHIFDFVKKIYEKNSKNPSAFEKYSIWGEVLKDCDLGPIFKENFLNLKLEENSSPAMFKIFANVLESSSLTEVDLTQVNIERNPPNILKSIINFNNFATRQITEEGTKQKVYKTKHLNLNFQFLEKILKQNNNSQNSNLMNLLDNLWYELIFKNLEIKKYKMIYSDESIDSLEEKHIFTMLLTQNFLKQTTKDEVQTFLNEANKINLETNFKTKWKMLKDNLRAKFYMESLSSDQNGNSEILRGLVNLINRNINYAQNFDHDNLDTNISYDFFKDLQSNVKDFIIYQNDKKYQENELANLEKELVIPPLNKLVIPPLNKLVLDHSDSHKIDISKIRYGIVDFSPISESLNKSEQVLEPIFDYSYQVTFVGEELNDNGQFKCKMTRGSEPVQYGCKIKIYQVSTNIIRDNRILEKSSNGKDSSNINLVNGNNEAKLLILNNATDGLRGKHGINAYFCNNGIYHPFTKYKEGKVQIFTDAEDKNEIILSKISNTTPPSPVDAVSSGDGGDGGNAGKIFINDKDKYEGIVTIALGGLGGEAGEIAECAVGHDKSRPLEPENSKHLIGKKGQNGKNGI